MRIILREDMQNLGEAGDVVEVKTGYARNYLIPNKLAMPASEGNLKTYRDIARGREKRAEKAFADANNLAGRLAGLELRFKVEVSPEDQLYGSVTAQMIVEALATRGLTVERRLVMLDSPIKELGAIDVPIHLHKQVEPAVKVVVEKHVVE